MISLNDIYWAAGFLEGEGCFRFGLRHPMVTAAQVQKEPLERLQKICYSKLFLTRKSYKETVKPIWIWSITCSKAIGLMMTLYPLMSPKRQDSILKTINIWKSRKPHPKYRTHCSKGHKFSPSNIRYDKRGRRYCIQCEKDSLLRLRLKTRDKRVFASKSQLSLSFATPPNISNE